MLGLILRSYRNKKLMGFFELYLSGSGARSESSDSGSLSGVLKGEAACVW